MQDSYGAKHVKSDDILHRVLSTAATVFQVSPKAVSLNSQLQQLGTWDSLSHLNFILALEQEFRRRFTEEEIERLTSVSAAVEVISAKQAI